MRDASFWLAILQLHFALHCAIATASEPVTRVWSFQDIAINSAPDFFDYLPNLKDRREDWLVIDDCGERVLRQQDLPDAKDRPTLAIIRDDDFEHVQATVKIKAVGGKLEQCAGLVWRMKDAENYLLARFDIEDKQMRLVRVVDGNRVIFAEKNELKVQLDQWYTLRVDHRGEQVSVYLDNDIVLMGEDRHIRKPGRVGLYTASDSIINFKQLTVRALQRD